MTVGPRQDDAGNAAAPVLVQVQIPACYSTDVKHERNRARQLLVPSALATVNANESSVKTSDGQIFRVVATASGLAAGERALAVGRNGLKDVVAALSTDAQPRWVGALAPASSAAVRTSWNDCFSFQTEDTSHNRRGLRIPQIGAVHAVLGFWSTGTKQPGTVVMPTGTGKTEAMIALLACQRPERLLVVVPSDVLRQQLASKFESFGVLQQFGVIAATAMRPIVGQLRHGFSTAEEARAYAEQCNVVISTPSALYASTPDANAALLGSFSHLFVDEAHHVEAATWRRIRDSFDGKYVLQFTATPFREDGRRLAGRLVYSFPLRQAQQLGYFSTVNYIPVVDFASPDRAIAEKAVAVLRADLAAARDHIVMARVKRIGRATDIQLLYAEIAPEYTPVVLHSTMPSEARASALRAIRTRASRIIVCVDMLGEGFDLPSLKIAAIHDIHKSLGVTLQFVGRFARVAGSTIGNASVVAGRPEGQYDENLRRLYSEEPDWNLIIRDLSENVVGTVQSVSDFEAAFTSRPEELSLSNIAPKMSTVVYRTQCASWNPHAVHELFEDGALFTDPIGINEHDHVAWFVVEQRFPVRWGEVETIAEVRYDLYVMYWDEAKQLLYINSSANEGVYEDLAAAVCGASTTHISGEAVYRVMASIARLVPTNVGLLDVRNRGRRFSMHVGADVIEGFPIAEAQTKTKTNIFAYGYDGGVRVGIGASLKGRIWSYRVAHTLKHWMDWCNSVGAKVSDSAISVDDVMRGFIRPKVVDARPVLVVLGLEWSWEVHQNTSTETCLSYNGQDVSIVDAELEVAEFGSSGPVRFRVATDAWTLAYECQFLKGRMQYRAVAAEAELVTRGTRAALSVYLNKVGITMLLEQDAMIVPPGMLLKPDRDAVAIDGAKLRAIDWSGINLRKESQGPARDADSVQARAIAHVTAEAAWDVVLDDDGKGEIADIVAMRVDGQQLVVKLVHCKYSSESVPGARLIDLFEVCGQAQKSVRWRRSIDAMFRMLIQREQRRMTRHGRSGFLVGDGNALYRLEDRSRLLRPSFTMTIAQPGMSRASASRQQLELLGATETYLYEVAHASLDVLCSA